MINPTAREGAEPLGLTKELSAIKARLESLEQRILSLGDQRLGPQLHVTPNYDWSKLKVKETL